jgi:hypothetical protein
VKKHCGVRASIMRESSWSSDFDFVETNIRRGEKGI